MGCSASRPANSFTHNQNPNSNSSSSLSTSQLQSPFSDRCSTPVSRTLSLPTPLVHHPPLRKGDSNHFVALTSTSYGSLILIEPPTDNQDLPHPNPQDLSPDSVINTWELMQGLDDDDEEPLHSEEFPQHHQVSKPLWKHLSEESLLAKMDSNVVNTYQKALLGRKTKPDPSNNPSSQQPSRFSGVDNRIVVYYTSLRGIRKTYEDCCNVRMIFRGFRVCVDERDISMDRSYRVELQAALGRTSVPLPQVFIRGRYIGGAEEIKQLNEAGELAKLLEGFPLMDVGYTCDGCGDARFLPCPNCSGSQKIYEKDGKLKRCPECNENGLIRCLNCCP